MLNYDLKIGFMLKIDMNNQLKNLNVRYSNSIIKRQNLELNNGSHLKHNENKRFNLKLFFTDRE